MKILITNDDGIDAPGIRILTDWAKKLGEVAVVAPSEQQSGKSQSLKLHESYAVKRVERADGIAAWAVDSTPADCIRVADAWLGLKPDLVLSGVNLGYNVGWDIVYSATCGAIFEAAFLGVPAVAVSTSHEHGFRGVAENLDRVAAFIRERKLLEICPLLNVNIPPEGGEILITRQGGPYIRDGFRLTGEDMIHADPHIVHDGSFDPEIDLDAVLNGYISVTPLSVNRTDTEAYRRMRG